MLPEDIKTALVDLARRFELAGVAYRLGGSAMLRLAGIDVAVNDIDVVVEAPARSGVIEALADLGLEEPTSSEPWRSDWFLRTKVVTSGDPVGVDIIGGMALVIDGVVVRFPFEPSHLVRIDEIDIAVAPLAQWYHLYRVHDSSKAAVVASHLQDGEIMAAASDLGIAHVFSPTLIVRIGNGSPTNGIEETMSNDVQTSIIEVASPTDQTFDEPGTGIIDQSLLEETLEYVRPALQADGGDLILLGTEGGKVTLQLVGACGGCPLSTMTLTAGIERILQDRVPGVTEVVSV